jgi:hypothetical protein
VKSKEKNLGGKFVYLAILIAQRIEPAVLVDE